MANIIHKGRVLDQNGRPLYQAHVITINSTPKRGVVTDQNGNFTVQGGLLESFEITHIGFRSKIFRLDKYIKPATYSLFENVNQLDGVVVMPRVPKKTKTPFDLNSIFEVVNNIFTTAPQVTTAPLDYRARQIKVLTTTRGPVLNNQLPIVTGNGPIYQTAPSILKTNGSVADWIKNNPIKTGGIALAGILLGTALVAKKKNGGPEIDA